MDPRTTCRVVFVLWLTIVGLAPLIGQVRLATNLGHGSPVQCTAISSDGSLGLTGGQDGTARLWDLSSGAELREFVKNGGPVNGVSLSSDGRLVATGSQDGSAHLWDSATGAEIEALSPVGYGTDSIELISFLPGGEQVLVSSSQYPGRIWDPLLKEPQRTKEIAIPDRLAHRDEISSPPVYSQDGKQVTFGLSTGTVVTVDWLKNKVASSLSVSSKQIISVDISPNGDLLAAADTAGEVTVWRIQDGKRLFVLPDKPDPATLRGDTPTAAVSFGRLEANLIVTTRKNVELWDLKSLSLVKTAITTTSRFTSTSVSKDHSLALTGTSGGEAYLWDIESGSILKTLGGRSSTVFQSCLAPTTITLS